MAESNWNDARQFIDEALTGLRRIETPRAAWQVLSTAFRLYRRAGQPDTAAAHRAQARAQIAALVESFPGGEPLRDALLGAPAVRRIGEEEVEVP
jgi:hypothetical protein